MNRRLPIHRNEAVVYGELAPGPQARLTERLYDLWHTFFLGRDAESFARDDLKDDTYLVLGLGRSGDLAGYGYINQTEVDVRGKDYLVLGGGVFNRLEYDNSAAINLALFWRAARVRLMHPRKRMVGISLSTSPIIYDTVERCIAVSAPRVGYEPPPEALEIAHRIAAQRDLSIDPNDPWVIHSDVRPAQPDKILSSRRYAQRTAAMRHFESRAPDWANGQGLLSWAPLDASNIARSIAKLTKVLSGQA